MRCAVLRWRNNASERVDVAFLDDFSDEEARVAHFSAAARTQNLARSLCRSATTKITYASLSDLRTARALAHCVGDRTLCLFGEFASPRRERRQTVWRAARHDAVDRLDKAIDAESNQPGGDDRESDLSHAYVA
jgi:hypothetical protein